MLNWSVNYRYLSGYIVVNNIVVSRNYQCDSLKLPLQSFAVSFQIKLINIIQRKCVPIKRCYF